MFTAIGVLLLGNIAIYAPKFFWLGALYGWAKAVLAWGLCPFITSDLLKLSLATMFIPTAWKFVKNTKGAK